MQPSTAGPDPQFRLGDHVRVRNYLERYDAVVVEDRGHIAPGGRQMYRVHVFLPEYEGGVRDCEVLASKLRPAPTEP